jgi:AcrR family transcriptional regulator
MKTTKTTTRAEGGRLTAEERRDSVLNAAVVEFAAYGLYGASTEAIAERAGISQPYIFRLFGTKQELFREAVERVVDRILSQWRAAVAADPAHPLPAMERSMEYLMHNRDELVLLLHAFAAARDPEACLFGRNRLREIYMSVAQISGATDDEMHDFFAHAMLMMVACAMDLPAIAQQHSWIANLIRPRFAAAP